ncbi:MAG TPA: hypothetical protein PKY82_31000 [Pyrinomonadaceae bacterium]|nr:hypothetical protein [Pyrinomonadaceae bacterium]
MSNLELIFKILAAVLLGVAAFFLWRNNMDGVFVSAVIGAVCFFVSIRFQITERKKNSSTKEHEENTKEGK